MKDGTLHLARGDTALLAAAPRIPRRRVITSADSLTVGPVRPIRDLGAWVSERAAVWGRPMWKGDLYRVLCEDPARLRAAELVVWSGPALDEQLFVAFALAALSAIGVDLARVSIAELTRDRRGAERSSLGQFLPSEFDPALARPVDLDQRDRLARGWAAFTSREPGAMAELLEREPACLFTERAKLLARRYPALPDGLPPWDRRLLELVDEEWTPIPRFLVRCAKAGLFDELDQRGDLVLVERLAHFGRPGLRRPLVEVAVERVRSTVHGGRVLAGERRADTAAIHDHVGGVRLDPVRVRAWHALVAAGRWPRVPGHQLPWPARSAP